MDKKPPAPRGGFPEHNEPTVQGAGIELTPIGIEAEQTLIAYLLEMDFTWDEVMSLLDLREHLYEGAEMRQRMANDHRMHFARWLYEHGELQEG
jgi:hypothetical protein